jgi:hypothetical protein
MKQTSVFVTYNPGNEFEQTLAVRLHTIGAVHGFTMLMPDRFNSTAKLNAETIHRIKSADYFIFFSTSPLTPIVQQEINTAFTHLKDKSKILIIYNKVKNLKHNQNCTEVFIDAKKESSQEILAKAIDKIKVNQQITTTKRTVKQDDSISALGGILLIGLGLITLDAVFNSSKK